ncbi:MAG: PAS domain-containing protein [Candidatus Thorarchaeota archaeon]
MKLEEKIGGTLLDSLHVGVVVLDARDNIVIFNRMAGELLQLDPESRIGTSVLLCHSEKAEAGVLKMLGQMRSGELREYEGWVDFAGRIVYEYLYPLWDENGGYAGAVAEIHDGTERAEYLKSRGEWKDLDSVGIGERAPRSPHPEVK